MKTVSPSVAAAYIPKLDSSRSGSGIRPEIKFLHCNLIYPRPIPVIRSFIGGVLQNTMEHYPQRYYSQIGAGSIFSCGGLKDILQKGLVMSVSSQSKSPSLLE